MKYLVWIIVIIVIAGGGLILLNDRDTTAPDADDTAVGAGGVVSGQLTEETDPGVSDMIVADESAVEEENVDETPTGTTITYTDDGYSPREVTIAQGETVAFVNESSREMWPASIIHPTHAVYPNSSISKCGTTEAGGIFDACQRHPAGTSWSFTFEEVGVWRFHDHLRPSQTGTITVE